MKQHATFTLDENVLKQLKNEPNASLLINDLLLKHYATTPEQLQAKKQEITAKIETFTEEQARLEQTLKEFNAAQAAKKEAAHAACGISQADLIAMKRDLDHVNALLVHPGLDKNGLLAARLEQKRQYLEKALNDAGAF